MRASDEAHEWAQAGSGHRPGKEQTGNVGFEVVIEDGSTAHRHELFAERGRWYESRVRSNRNPLPAMT